MSSPFTIGHGSTVFDPRSAGKKNRGNKFGAKKASCHHGHVHDSQKEAARCNELHLLQRSGQISDLQNQPQYLFAINGRQVKHLNGRRAGYRADFSYIENDKRIVEDVKGGYDDNAWPLRKAIFCHLFPDIELREV